jgi:peroxiredoxin
MDPKLLSIELPNVGEGPDPLSLATLVWDVDFLVLLLMQSHRSGTCCQQAREVAERYGEFRRLDAEVVSVVPGSRPHVRSWRTARRVDVSGAGGRRGRPRRGVRSSTPLIDRIDGHPIQR